MAATNATFKLGISFRGLEGRRPELLPLLRHHRHRPLERRLPALLAAGPLRKASSKDLHRLQPRDGRRLRRPLRPPAAQRPELRLPPRRRPVRQVPARDERGLRRAAHRRQDRRRAAWTARDGKAGDITALQMQDGARIDGDLFIDCTGFRSMLHRRDARRGLRGLDPLAALRPRRGRADGVRARGLAVHARHLPTRSAGSGASRCRTASATAWSTAARRLSDADAPEVLKRNVEGELLIQPRVTEVHCPASATRSGHRNCIAVGPGQRLRRAAGVHQHPPDPARGHPADADLPGRAASQQADVDEFNLQSKRELEHIRDFVVLHYHRQRTHRLQPLEARARDGRARYAEATASTCSARVAACSAPATSCSPRTPGCRS